MDQSDNQMVAERIFKKGVSEMHARAHLDSDQAKIVTQYAKYFLAMGFDLGRVGTTAYNKRPVQQFLDGVLVDTHPSMVDAAHALRVTHQSISRACKNNNRTVKGYHFKYSDIETE